MCFALLVVKAEVLGEASGGSCVSVSQLLPSCAEGAVLARPVQTDDRGEWERLFNSSGEPPVSACHP